MLEGPRFQVLALDGGGIEALFAAQILAQLEEDFNLEVRNCFDLIEGTSAGGIIALALGAGLRRARSSSTTPTWARRCSRRAGVDGGGCHPGCSTPPMIRHP